MPDPTIREPTDAVVRMTTTAICGSDLHLYEVLTPFIPEGLALGHEPMGVEGFHTHQLPLDQGPRGYDIFQ